MACLVAQFRALACYIQAGYAARERGYRLDHH
jgi:hypothetical protein